MFLLCMFLYVLCIFQFPVPVAKCVFEVFQLSLQQGHPAVIDTLTKSPLGEFLRDFECEREDGDFHSPVTLETLAGEVQCSLRDVTMVISTACFTMTCYLKILQGSI